jgi:xanthine dehydrogenase FAD-binding subunit
MQHFEFYSARSIDDALGYLSDKKDRCKILAGGTDLIPALRLEDLRPDFVLNILEIKDLQGVKEEDHSIRVGPAATFTDITESDLLNRHFPLLVRAAASVGGPQIRNRGTIGGNISNASPAADVLPAVLALEGELELRSRAGFRKVSLSEAISAPYKTLFRPDELLTGILIKKLQPETKTVFEKLGRRNAMARARMNVSIVLGMDKQEKVTELRIVPGAVMPVARRARRSEKKLLGQKPTESLIESSVETLAEEMVEVTGRRWSTEYKVPVLKNITRRLLRQLVQN